MYGELRSDLSVKDDTLEFPLLMKTTGNPVAGDPIMVVLMTSPGVGMVVAAEEGYEDAYIGYHADCWEMEVFEPLAEGEEVVLRN